MFDDLSGGSGRGLGPKKIASVGIEALKFAKGGFQALSTLTRFGRLIYLVVILVATVVLSGMLVATVKKGTYQVRQMVVSGTMRAKMEPGM